MALTLPPPAPSIRSAASAHTRASGPVLLAALALAILGAALAPPLPARSIPASAAIHWRHHAAAAFARAHASSRNLVIDLYATWCVDCTRLDQTTFRDPALVAWSHRAVFLKQDADHDGLPLARRYQVDAYPTLLFLDPAGNLVGRIVGYHTGPQMLQIFQQLTGQVARLDRRLAAASADPQTSLREAVREVARQQFPAARSRLRGLRSAIGPASPLYPQLLLAEGVLAYRTGRLQPALERCNAVLTRHPAPVDALFARYYRILSLYRLGRREQAAAAIRDFQRRYPHDPHLRPLNTLLNRLRNPFEDN